MNELTITSTAFRQGGWVPDRHSGYGEDISPELRIDGMTESAVSMVITLDDISHPLFPNYNHWIAWNLEPARIIPEALPKGAMLESPVYCVQGIAYGKHCYRGPKPPFHWNHSYTFTVFILDTKLDLPPSSRRQEVCKAMKGHILQKGTLTGKYQRGHHSPEYC